VSEPQRDNIPAAPTDLASLAHFAASLAVDLGMAWSDALDLEALERALPGTQTRIVTLLQALAESYTERDERLEQRGVDVRLPDWPVSPATVLGLDSHNPEEHWRGLLFANLEAVELLTAALGPLGEPSGVAVDLLTGEERRRWFESGAFALVGSRARLVERLSRRLDAAEALLLGRTGSVPVASRDDAIDAIQAAGIAFRRGDPEASVWHLVRAARIAVASSELTGANDEWESLGQFNDFSELADLLRAAAALVDDYENGGVHTATAMPLARLLLPRVQRLVLAPPDLGKDEQGA
jgi:hypothetical protein